MRPSSHITLSPSAVFLLGEYRDGICRSRSRETSEKLGQPKSHDFGYISLVSLFLPLAVLSSFWPIDHACAQDEKPVRVVLHAVPAPHPALKYQLLPTLYERRPGNAAVFYGRIKAEQDPFFSSKEIWDNIDRALDAPLDEVRDMEHILRDHARSIFRNLERGGQCRDCDWQYPVQEDRFNTMLPDAQEKRQLARMLWADARKRIALGDLDGALRSIKAGYAMAQHTANAPFIVTGLVGWAVSDMMSECVLELIQQPGAPNLYWALTYLPDPLLDFRKIFEGEMLCLAYAYPQLRNVDHSITDPEYWRRQLIELGEFHQEYYGYDSDKLARFQRQMPVRLLRAYPLAKRALIEQGMSPKEVEAMPAGRVIILHSSQQFEEMRDEYLKVVLLPYWEALPYLDGADERMDSDRRRWENPLPLYDVFPAIRGGRTAFARLDRQIAVLRILEAIRLHGATHAGRLPNGLEEIEVPVPIDPITGKPFEYRVHNNVAHLEGPPMPGRPCRYEITLLTDNKPKGE